MIFSIYGNQFHRRRSAYQSLPNILSFATISSYWLDLSVWYHIDELVVYLKQKWENWSDYSTNGIIHEFVGICQVYIICCTEQYHCDDVIMSVVAYEITSLTIVYSTVFFRRRSKKTSKLRVTGLCLGNSPVTGEFAAQMASKGANVPFDDVIMVRVTFITGNSICMACGS